MSAETCQKLFQPFVQADNSMTRRFGGTGLGLAISQQLVTLMEGKIDVKSELHRGSMFSVSLDLDSAKAPMAPVSLALPQIGFRSLVAIRHAIQARECVTHLTSWGVICDQTESPEATERKLMEATGVLGYKLVLIDSQLLEAGAEKLTALLAEQRSRNQMRIVLITDLARGSGLNKPQVDALLFKPIGQAKLYTATCEALSSKAADIPQTPLAAATKRKAGPYADRPWRVLVVEDNAVNRRVGLAQLQNLGLSPKFAEDGKIAVALAAREEFDLIFMDCQMPEQDGLETTQLIRQLPNASAQARIIALTGNAMSGDQERCIKAGMDDYLTKPMQKKELCAAIERQMTAQT
jgi:CheY-like chemotaxis protein